MEAINIILDCKDPQNPIFVEIENDEGFSISIGENIKGLKKDFRCVRITASEIEEMED